MTDEEYIEPLIHHPDITSQRQTCIACPEQYDGELIEGLAFYFRYRGGVASLTIGPNLDYVQGYCESKVRVTDDGLIGVFESDQERDGTFALLLRMERARIGSIVAGS